MGLFVEFEDLLGMPELSLEPESMLELEPLPELADGPAVSVDAVSVACRKARVLRGSTVFAGTALANSAERIRALPSISMSRLVDTILTCLGNIAKNKGEKGIVKKQNVKESRENEYSEQVIQKFMGYYIAFT